MQPTSFGVLELRRIQPPTRELAHCQCYYLGECAVFVAIDPSKERGVLRQRWHLSISHPSRYPSWDEIKEARYRLTPDQITMAMILPPTAEYVNLHPNCFHLHEIDGEDE